MLLLKQLIIILIASATLADEENNLSAEQQREMEMDDLIRTLEERMKANRASSAESGVVTSSLDHERDLRAAAEGQQQQQRIIDEPEAREEPIKPLDGEGDGVGDARDKRKVAPKSASAKEPAKLSPKTQRSPPPSDFEKDEAYYKSLLRLQNHYQLHNKRYLDDAVVPPLAQDFRPSRHCGGGGHADRKLDRITTSRVRYLERSRLLADRIAGAAMNMVQKKSRIMDCLHSACGCGHNRPGYYDEPLIIGEPEPAVVVAEVVEPVIVAVEEPTKRRDVEVAATSSSATELAASVDAGGVSVDAASATSAATATNIDTGVGGASVSTASEVTSDVHVGASVGGAGISAGISTESHLNVGHGAGGGLWSQLRSCDDYERKMVMDLAIEEAADMIRRLAYETRTSVPPRDDPAYERRILGLAINLVNKVTAGTTGDRLDVFGDFRYNNVDDYLRSSIADGEIEADYVSNAGFDYAGTGRHLYDSLDGVDDYVGYSSPYSRGRCDTCAKYDITLGNRCPLCKRSGHMFQGRIRRDNAQPDKGKIYHLEQLPQVQSKVNN